MDKVRSALLFPAVSRQGLDSPAIPEESLRFTSVSLGYSRNYLRLSRDSVRLYKNSSASLRDSSGFVGGS